MGNKSIIIGIIVLSGLSINCRGETIKLMPDSIVDDTPYNKPLLTKLTIGVGVAYTASMIGLYNLWYKDYPQSSFHFIDDSREWMQMDKAGHIISNYQIGLIGYETMRLAGVSNKKSALIGGSLGFFYMATVEAFDGFSAEWGASGSDILANAIGTSTFIIQQLTWQEQRISFKYSYHPTSIANFRPDLLGKTDLSRAVKDYNGSTFWVSVNLKSFTNKESVIPDWLNIAVGHGATGMLGGYSNPEFYNEVRLPVAERYRKYYISLDIDPTKLRIRNKTSRYIIRALSFIKIPMPTIEFNRHGVKFHALYF